MDAMHACMHACMHLNHHIISEIYTGHVTHCGDLFQLLLTLPPLLVFVKSAYNSRGYSRLGQVPWRSPTAKPFGNASARYFTGWMPFFCQPMWLTPLKCAPLHVLPYQIWSFCIKGCRHKSGVIQILRHTGAPDRGCAWPVTNTPIPTWVTA